MSAFAIARMLMPLVVIGLTLGVTTLFLRRGFPGPWERWVKRALKVGLGIALVGFVGWEVLRVLRPHSPEAGAAMTLTSTVFVSAIALALTAVVWGPSALVTRQRPTDPSRRAFLRGVTGAVPWPCSGVSKTTNKGSHRREKN